MPSGDTPTSPADALASPADALAGPADTVRALRGPLLTGLQAAAAQLQAAGWQRDKAQAWVAAELLAVLADVLAEGLPGSPEHGLLGDDVPFDDADTEQHLDMERHLAAIARRLEAVGFSGAEATLQAGSLALASVAGVLAGIVRDR